MTVNHVDESEANTVVLTLNMGCVSRKHEKGRIIAPTSKFIFMKKFFLSICAVAMAATGMAQDASQPQGSWYLGTGDATTLLNVFSTGVGILPTIGYAVADDIVVDANMSGSTDDLSLDLRVGYFMGDNYIGIGAGDIAGDMDLGVRFGHYIDFKDVLYISPNLQYNFGLPEGASDNLQLQIGFGTRF